MEKGVEMGCVGGRNGQDGDKEWVERGKVEIM